MCHQLGNQATREILNPGDFDSTEAAWAHRVRVGQRGSRMNGGLRRFGADRAVAMYADWTDRIMAGEVPEAPPRPQGQERNVVLTMWEWGGETGYVHDEIATDKRNPQVNAGGPVYGVEFANDKLVWVDPRTNAARAIQIPVRDTPGEGDFRSYIDRENLEPSLYWGDELIWDNPGNPAQPDDGWTGTHLDDAPDPRPRQPGVVPGRVGQPVRTALSAVARRPARRLLRPGG